MGWMKKKDSDQIVPQESSRQVLLTHEQIELIHLKRAVRMMALAILSKDAGHITRTCEIVVKLTEGAE
jgi:hypothetical protein